jgi:VWFA-related protein
MLRWSYLVALLLLTCASVADNVTFLRVDKTIVQQRLDQAPPTTEQRVTVLRSMFEKAGCSRQNIQVQPVPDQTLPNVICTLPGTEFGTILVSARLDYDTRGDEATVGWGGAAMLPLLAESLNSTTHRHTLVFAAFSGGNQQGASYFWKSLSDAERREYRGMVDLDHLGRTPAGFSAAPNAASMARVLPAAARALRYNPEPQLVADVPEGNAQVFERAHIPAITIYSVGYRSSGGEEASTSKLQPVMPGTGHTAPVSTSRNFSLQTALDPAVYNDTYNLLCVYVLFLDRGLGASKRPMAESQVAKAEVPEPASAPPVTQAAVPPATPPAVSTTSAAQSGTVAALQPPPSVPTAQVAEQSAGGNLSTATIRVNTRLVQFDVVVTDKDGRPVKDLKESDFQVQQDGKSQSIVAFETHAPTVAGQTTPEQLAASSASAAAPNTFTNSPAKAPQSSWTVILFDLLNTATADQAYARNQLLQLLRSLPKGQPVALFVLTRQLEMLQGFTQDPEDLLRRAGLLQPSRSQDLTTMAERERETGRIVSTAQQAAPTSGMAAGASFNSDSIAFSQASRILQNYNDHEAFRSTDRALFTLAAMKGMARAVSGYPGRKNMIWLSGSFPVDIEPNPSTMDPFRNVRGFEEEIRQTSSLLATSRVAVYPVDVRGLQSKGIDFTMASSETQFMNDPLPSTAQSLSAPSASAQGNTLTAESTALINDRVTMKNIAQQTGGEAFVNTNDLKRVIARSLEDGSTYYTLAYTPPKEDEGGYHKVAVVVPNKNWKLAYRRGYYSIPPVTASGAVGTAALRTALQPGMPPSTSMLLTASLELPDAKRPEVKLNYVINSNGVDFTDAPDNKKRAQIDCMVIAFDSSGKEVAHASDTLDATMPANAYAAVMAHGLPAHQLIALPPGRYNLRIGVMDRTTQQIGTVDAPLEVPELAVAQK